MKISIRDVNDVKIVDLEGALNTNTAPQAEAQVNQLLDQGTKKILANFKNMNYVSSVGLRVLLVTAKKMGSSGGTLRVCSLNPEVQEVFDISGFSVILNVFKTEAEALDGF